MNERVLQLFERYLVPEGYRVTAVADGEQALEAAEAECPAVIVLDVMMRTIDGWELLQRLPEKGDARHAEPLQAGGAQLLL